VHLRPSFSKNIEGAVLYLNWLAISRTTAISPGQRRRALSDGDGVPPPLTLSTTKNPVSTGDLCLIYNGNPNLAENLASTLVNLPEKDRPVREMAELIGNHNAFAPRSLHQSSVRAYYS
jgi:hypothetical protein